MKQNNYITLLPGQQFISGILVLLWMFCASCGKEFLEEKPNKSLLIPTTLANFQSMLDNPLLNRMPALNIIASDDLQNNGNLVSLAFPAEKGAYLWEQDMYGGSVNIPDWELPYQQLFYANIVLDGLADMTSPEAKRLKGSALFFRAFALFNLAQSFAKPFNAGTAKLAAGVPARLESDVNVKATRGTVQETYDRIQADLKAASGVLNTTENYKSRPSKHAVMALFARVYLSMQAYDQAERYADSALQISSALIDYNTLNATAANPVPIAIIDKNAEGIFYAIHTSYSFFNSALTAINPSIYQLYNSNDMRKTIFFNDKGGGLIGFKGSYNGDRTLYGGLATDEMYLIRGECLARKGNADLAMADLNTLLLNRWKKGTFVPFKATDGADALKQILVERRKELVWRGLRWSDLRRFNQDPIMAITLTRNSDGKIYTLLPNSNRYVFPIPDNEVRGSGIEQNPR
ncbi:MAG: RagB/SusD family nutrient uptake outer membrane protein [Daejeonella sp.]